MEHFRYLDNVHGEIDSVCASFLINQVTCIFTHKETLKNAFLWFTIFAQSRRLA